MNEQALSPWQVGRPGNWWEYKIPPVMAGCFAATAVYGVPAVTASWHILLILLTGVFAGSYGHIVNDVFDVEADRLAGKENHMARFSPAMRFLLCAACVIPGFLPLVLAGATRTSVWLLAIEYLLPTIYSAPPLRLKTRGWLGVMADALGAHTVPALFVLSVFAPHGAGPAHQWLAVLIGVWTLFFGLKGICIHEYIDREADRRAGVRTWATERDPLAARATITRLYGVELLSFAGLCAYLGPYAGALAAAVLAYAAVLGVKAMRAWNFLGPDAPEEGRVQRWQLTGPFYECYLPMALAVSIAWEDPRLAWAPVGLPLVFRGNFRDRFREVRSTAAYVGMRVRRVITG